MVLAGLFWSDRARAAEKTFLQAIPFYETYGSSRLVFSEGSFYYASRGKEGDPRGIRYGVAGQKFTFRTGKKTFLADIALEGEGHAGSCKRISYQKKDGYCYSLYRVTYEDLFCRWKTRYPLENFEQLLYNRKVHFQVDFYLTLVIDGQDQGWIHEEKDGSCRKEGKIYQSAEEIEKAAAWSAETRKAFSAYYKIQLDVYQPSNWFISYRKNDPDAEGTMERQEFTYGVEQSLLPCSFKRRFYVELQSQELLPDGRTDCVVHKKMLTSRFLGWSLTAGGRWKYQDQQKVKNLTSVHREQIPLYAQWSSVFFTFPDMSCEDFEFLGWSSRPVNTSDGKEESEKPEFLAGERIEITENRTFYAVWKRKQYKVRFRVPEGETWLKREVYSSGQIKKIKETWDFCGLAGSLLNEVLIKTGLASFPSDSKPGTES